MGKVKRFETLKAPQVDELCTIFDAAMNSASAVDIATSG